MAIIGRPSARCAGDIARVYVDTWRTAYAGLLPDKVLLGMSYERQTGDWSWVIRNRAESQPIIVATEIGHGVVGFISYGRSRAADRPAEGPCAERQGGPRVGEVFTLYVLPEFQDRGIGRQLLLAAFTSLRDRGFERALLWVLRANNARFFYERLGGVRISERRERLWGCQVDETAYGWPDLRRTIARIGSCSAS
ncbi:MAG TPA: GNAT family N-acetyltransferase [Alphaproteobacteria bacterium]|jgi:ribosomal protein S18 acetylase RimI-like enzyme|nr:GNAT family N-acetyltransferase [Alphaproteobacteria bacterium]